MNTKKNNAFVSKNKGFLKRFSFSNDNSVMLIFHSNEIC